MSTQVQFRRGTTAENDAFTGAIGEITVDTTKNEMRVHDGSTAGGFIIGSSFPSGTRMFFQQGNAPTGWTKLTGYDEHAIRVVNSLGSPDRGGSVNFSTAFASGGVTGSTAADLAAHTHTTGTALTGTNGALGHAAGNADPSTSTGSTGAGGGHTYTMAINVKFIDTILCIKD